jgi:hypothetical protein
MLKFTSASGSDFRAITAMAITRMLTITRTGITTGRTIALIIDPAPITGQAAIGITAITIPTAITDTNFEG